MLSLPKAIFLSTLVLCISGILVSVVTLGRYELTTNERGLAYRMNRSTGELWVCTPTECRRLRDQTGELDLSKLF